MQIDLPQDQDIVERVQKRAAAANGASAAEVIRLALDSLDWQEQERQAIQEGIVAWRDGNTQDFDEFDEEFRATHGIQARR